MRALISALAVAGLVAFALPGYADDVKYDPAKAAAKPGRSIDDPSVKTDPAASAAKPGRAADDSTSGKQNVKTNPDMTKPGRAADDTKPATTSKKKKKKTTQPTN